MACQDREICRHTVTFQGARYYNRNKVKDAQGAETRGLGALGRASYLG